MYTVLIVLHVIVCVFLMLVVLLQAGKGGGMGIGFGSASSQTVFGSSGAGNFLSRLTAVFATVFILNSLCLAYLSSRQDAPRLRELAEQQAAQKKAEEATKQKIKDDIEKASQAIEGATGEGTSTPGTGAGEGTSTPGTSASEGAPPTAPSTAPATDKDTAPGAE